MNTIYFNNEKKLIETNLNLYDFLNLQNFIDASFAIAINKKFVPRCDYHKTILQNNDQIILLQPMQGG